VIGGQLRPDVGRVRLGAEDVTGLAPFAMWKRGMTRTFQRNSIFPTLSVLRNVRLAVLARRGLGGRLLAGAGRHKIADEEAAEVLERVRLAGRNAIAARDLAYGEQRQLELAIALAGSPRILLLDEPTAGMSPAETDSMVAMLGKLERGITLLIVEHDMDVVFALADRVTVLHMGKVLAEGAPREIERDPRVAEVYFGEPETVL
jgi:branched-chain amino acid transport system ATP-binding protein